MNRRCLYCYEAISQRDSVDFHPKCSLVFFGTTKEPKLPYSLDQMAELARDIVERHVTIPGVQPKLSLSLVRDSIDEGPKGRLTVVGALGGNYIFKPPSPIYPEMPQNEHVTMRIAEDFGIRIVPSSLIRLQSGELAYITKRIDRTDAGQKIHMLDMFQILGAFDKYKGSLERIGKALGEYSSSTLLDKLYFFELTVFSYLTGNNDMHLKNFSMINSDDQWNLAPAYDLLNVAIANPDDTEELALTLEGKKRRFSLEHFQRFGNGLGLTERQIHGVFKRFAKNKGLVKQWIDRSFLSEEFKAKYMEVINSKYQMIGILA